MKLSLLSLMAATVVGCAAPSEDAASSTANETQEAAVHFGMNAWEPTWTGNVTAGSSLKIDYDFDRLTTCRNQSTLVSWVIEANVRFDGGAIHSFVLPGSPGAGEETDEIAIPAGAKSIELWFENRAVGGYDHCTAFDSRYGENYSRSL